MQSQLITDAQQAAVVAAEERRKREDAAAIKRGPLLAWVDVWRKRQWYIPGRDPAYALLTVRRKDGIRPEHELCIYDERGHRLAKRVYEGDTVNALALCEEALRRWVRGQVGDDVWDKLFTLSDA